MQVDKTILKACIRGDEKAHRKLYEACFPFLMGVCMRYALSKEDAMELLNIGFYKILTVIHKYSGKGSFFSWAKKVMVNAIIDEMRKQKKYRQHISMMEESDLKWQVESRQEWFNTSAVSAEEILHFIAALPPLTASVFNLFAIDGYKHKEISEMLGIGLSASKWHYAQAKQKLQSQILERMKSSKQLNLVKFRT